MTISRNVFIKLRTLLQTVLVLSSLFLYSAANATPIAAIEIGSTGVKGRVIDLQRVDEGSVVGLRYTVLMRKDINVGIIDGATNNELTAVGIDRAVSAIKDLVAEMKSHDPVHLTIVGSTSFDNYKNRIALENRVIESTGLKIRFITATDEIFFALRASIPRSFQNSAVLIDVGSGNTKLGYHSVLSGNKNFESLRIEYGSAKLRDLALARGGDFSSSVKAIIDQEVRPALRKQLDGHSVVFSPRRGIFIEGGAAWVASTFAHPQKVSEQYTKLSLQDFALSRRMMQTPNAPASLLSDEAQKQQNEILESPRLGYLWALAGSLLLEAVIEELKPTNRNIYFNRNTGWVIGYMINDYEEKSRLSR